MKHFAKLTPQGRLVIICGVTIVKSEWTTKIEKVECKKCKENIKKYKLTEDLENV